MTKQKRSDSLPRAHAQWSEKDEDDLSTLYSYGSPMEFIAEKLGRTIRAIQTQASKQRCFWRGERKRKLKVPTDPQGSLPLKADQAAGMPSGVPTADEFKQYQINQENERITRVEKARHLHPAIRPMVPDQPADIAKAHQDDMDRCDYFLVDTSAADGSSRIEGFGTIYAMNQALHTYAGSQVSRMVPMKRLPLAMMVIDD